MQDPAGSNPPETEAMTHPSQEIQNIRDRLRQIEEERGQLPEEASDERIGLKQEEHELRARLIRSQDAALKPWDTAELPGIPG